MIYDRPLTDAERQKSQLNYNRFCLVNGASYMCLGESVVVLFAVRMGMPNAVIALLGAMVYLGYLLLPLGVKRTGQVGAARCQADFWVCRNIAVLLVAASVLVNLINSYLAWATLLIGSFLFYGFRAAGCVMSQPLVGDIATEEEQPGLIGKTVASFYATGTLALTIISIILYFNDSLPVLVGVIIFGACLGITASSFCRRMDETTSTRDAAQKPIFSGLSYLLHTPRLLKLMLAWFLANLANIMIIPMSLLTLKRGYGVSDTTAILFSLCQFLTMIGMSYSCGPLVKKNGPRKVIIFSYLLFFPVAVFWILFPSVDWLTGWKWLLMLLPFILQGTATVIFSNAFTNYFLMAVPKEKQVGTSLLYSLVTGATAGIIGMLLAPLMLKIAKHFAADYSPLAEYRFYFSIALFFLLLILPAMIKLDNVIRGFRAEHGEEGVEKTVRRHGPHHRS